MKIPREWIEKRIEFLKRDIEAYENWINYEVEKGDITIIGFLKYKFPIQR